MRVDKILRESIRTVITEDIVDIFNDGVSRRMLEISVLPEREPEPWYMKGVRFRVEKDGVLGTYYSGSDVVGMYFSMEQFKRLAQKGKVDNVPIEFCICGEKGKNTAIVELLGRCSNGVM